MGCFVLFGCLVCGWGVFCVVVVCFGLFVACSLLFVLVFFVFVWFDLGFAGCLGLLRSSPPVPHARGGVFRKQPVLVVCHGFVI